MKKIFMCMLLLLMANAVLAQQDLPLEQRERLAELESVLASTNKLKAMVEEMSQAKRQECLKAFGHLKFCGCIAEKSPIALSFQQYISVVTHSKVENKYSALTSENKKIYNLALSTRDQCVKQL